VYFNINFNVFFKIKVHLFVSEFYIIKMHGATIKKIKISTLKYACATHR